MKFNPNSKKLMTNGGGLIKILKCPLAVRFGELSRTDFGVLSCAFCENNLVSTEYLSEEQVISHVNQNPNICLVVDLEQENLRIINHE